MQFFPLMLFIGMVAGAAGPVEGPVLWGWKEKGCRGNHWWVKRPIDDLFYCSDPDWLSNEGIKSVMLFLPDQWTADLYAKNGCPFPDSEDDSKRKSIEKEICNDIDTDKYSSIRMQRTVVPWLYGWSNGDCTGEAVELSPDTKSVNENVGTAPGYCNYDHRPFKSIAFDLPETMAATLYKKANCTHEKLQIQSEDSKPVGNRICTKNDAKEYLSYRLGLSTPKQLEK